MNTLQDQKQPGKETTWQFGFMLLALAVGILAGIGKIIGLF